MKSHAPRTKRIAVAKGKPTRRSTGAVSTSNIGAKFATADSGRSGTKIAKVVSVLRGPKGATIAALQKATGWQAHSVRGAISGTIKKKLGLTVVSERVGDVRTYRVVG